MILVDHVHKKAIICDPDGMVPDVVAFYNEEIVPYLQRSLISVGIRQVFVDTDVRCFYSHSNLCRFGNILSYFFPDTRSSPAKMSLRIVQVLRRMYVNSYRLRGNMPAQ